MNVTRGIEYYNFDIQRYPDRQKLLHLSADTPDDALLDAAHKVEAFFAPVIRFIGDACDAGGHVLVHCLAGAHRAGTTGVAFLMHAEQLKAEAAITLAQCLRPIIDPREYKQLFLMLLLLEHAQFGGLTGAAFEKEVDPTLMASSGGCLWAHQPG